MSEEEKKVIEKLRYISLWYTKYNRFESAELDLISQAVNLIEKQDKMIDYMAGRIVELLEEKNITNLSKKDVIDVFKNLAVNNLLKEVEEDAKN